jgi:hypothetical protein
MQEQSFIKKISSIKEIKNKLGEYKPEDYITIEIDIQKMISINDFFLKVYEELKCPEDF